MRYVVLKGLGLERAAIMHLVAAQPSHTLVKTYTPILHSSNHSGLWLRQVFNILLLCLYQPAVSKLSIATRAGL